MLTQRIFVIATVGLLLAFSPLAMACDISCAFASTGSDCNSAQVNSHAVASSGMDMNMSGMGMPETPNALSHLSQAAESSTSRAHTAHPSIGDMGPCEKQACDGGSAVFAESFRSGDSHSQLHFVAARTHRADAAPALFRVARDEITTQSIAGSSLLPLNLRI